MSNLEQGSKEWYEWRSFGVGASEIGAVLNISPYKTAHQLWLEKTGQAEGFKGNAATMRGNDLEDMARSAYMIHSGDVVSTDNTCLTHPKHSRIRASLDGWIDAETILEIKCPLEKNYEAMKDEIPEHYILQMQQQMLASGAKSCVFWVYHPDFGGYATNVAASQGDFDGIIDSIRDFWNKVDMFEWQSSDIDNLIESLAAHKAVEANAIEQCKEIETRLVQHMKQEGIKNAQARRAKVSLVNRKVTDKEACKVIEQWLAGNKMVGEGKADMVEVEKAHKKDGESYIRLTML
ncbi:MAG: YqaJ viral recombinase family protein [Mariprofundaceae bacterium]|nr:YqaJ viral recombinase family protein [Mariprofundaceae bacterium]